MGKSAFQYGFASEMMISFSIEYNKQYKNNILN